MYSVHVQVCLVCVMYICSMFSTCSVHVQVSLVCVMYTCLVCSMAVMNTQVPSSTLGGLYSHADHGCKDRIGKNQRSCKTNLEWKVWVQG